MKPADIARVLLLSAIWGASFLFMRVIAPVLGAVPTAFLRVLLGAIGLATILAVLRIKFSFAGKARQALLLGVLNSALPFVMYAVAARGLPAGYSAILNATTPMMGVLIGAALFGESLTLSKGIGVLLGLAGVTLLTGAGPVGLNATVLWSALACLVATACYGLAGFLTRRWLTGVDSTLVALGSQIGATLALLPLFAASVMFDPPPTWGDARVWLSLAALGLICTAFAYMLYFRLIADVGPVKTLTVTFLIPPFGVLWGALLLGESLSWAHAAGGALIGLAMWLILRPRRQLG